MEGLQGHALHLQNLLLEASSLFVVAVQQERSLWVVTVGSVLDSIRPRMTMGKLVVEHGCLRSSVCEAAVYNTAAVVMTVYRHSSTGQLEGVLEESSHQPPSLMESKHQTAWELGSGRDAGELLPTDEELEHSFRMFEIITARFL